MVLEKELLDRHYPFIAQMNVWDMMITRRDRLYDTTHVYPNEVTKSQLWFANGVANRATTSSLATGCNKAPCIVASTWTSMLSNLIYNTLMDSIQVRACRYAGGWSVTGASLPELMPEGNRAAPDFKRWSKEIMHSAGQEEPGREQWEVAAPESLTASGKRLSPSEEDAVRGTIQGSETPRRSTRASPMSRGLRLGGGVMRMLLCVLCLGPLVWWGWGKLKG